MLTGHKPTRAITRLSDTSWISTYKLPGCYDRDHNKRICQGRWPACHRYETTVCISERHETIVQRYQHASADIAEREHDNLSLNFKARLSEFILN